MAFPDQFESEIQNVGAGILFGNDNSVLSFPNFEDGIKIGRFAALDVNTDTIYNLVAPVPPVPVVGVVLQNPGNLIGEDSYSENSESGKVSQVDVLNKGLVSIEQAIDGHTPTPYAQVHYSLVPAHLGQATTSDEVSSFATPFRFIKEVKPNIWLIQSYDYDI